LLPPVPPLSGRRGWRGRGLVNRQGAWCSVPLHHLCARPRFEIILQKEGATPAGLSAILRCQAHRRTRRQITIAGYMLLPLFCPPFISINPGYTKITRVFSSPARVISRSRGLSPFTRVISGYPGFSPLTSAISRYPG
jgi:hypothetical protein